jgi:hypothetical protein
MPPVVVAAPIEVSPVRVDPALPSDPHLRSIADDVITNIRYSLAAVAAEVQPGAKGQLDQAFRALLVRQKPATRQRFRERAHAVLTGAPALRSMHFGRFSAVSPDEYSGIGSDELAGRVGKLSVNAEAVRQSLNKAQLTLGKVIHASPNVVVEHQAPGQPVIHLDPDVIGGLAFKKMRLFIRKVRCVEETDEWGSDAINMGGSFTTPDGKTTVLVDQFQVSDDFDEGELVDFGSSKAFASWDLATNPAGFPYVYSAVISLAEKDDGGFHKFLKDLWAQVEAKVREAVAGAVGGAIGGAIGAAVGFIAAAVVVAIIAWIVSLFENSDDIIGTQVVTMILAAATKSYYDWAKLTTPEGWTDTLHFKGDGGYYRVRYSFKSFTQ